MAKSPLPILLGGAAALILLGSKKGSNGGEGPGDGSGEGGGNGGGSRFNNLGRATGGGEPQNTTLSVAWDHLAPLEQNGLGSEANPLVFPAADKGDAMMVRGVPSKGWIFESTNPYMEFSEHYEPSFVQTDNSLVVTTTTRDGAPDFKFRKSGSGSQWIHVRTEK
jgi:hypothetical protein